MDDYYKYSENFLKTIWQALNNTDGLVGKFSGMFIFEPLSTEYEYRSSLFFNEELDNNLASTVINSCKNSILDIRDISFLEDRVVFIVYKA